MQVLSNDDTVQSLCLITRFKNERHILYEFIHHYLLEGVEFFLLIDDGSNDDFYLHHEHWLKPLIESRIVKIIASNKNKNQRQEYNLHINRLLPYHWVIMCDMDEFFFSVSKNSTIKKLLNSSLSKYNYISIPWKLFRHHSKFQPKSVIENNRYTHRLKIDPSSPSKGYKYIVRTNGIKKLNIHKCHLKKNKKKFLRIANSHNKIIQINHYRTQSNEYLYGVKSPRGSGDGNKMKYRNYKIKKHKFQKTCTLLRDKRKELIQQCIAREQIKPKHNLKDFYIENKNHEVKETPVVVTTLTTNTDKAVTQD